MMSLSTANRLLGAAVVYYRLAMSEEGLSLGKKKKKGLWIL